MKSNNCERAPVLVIGAGPSGAVVSTLIKKSGIDVLVLERGHFPRFSIGESLLPQCMAFLEEDDMLKAVQEEGFQYKNGAAFQKSDRYTEFDFSKKFSDGHGTTYQVQRGPFDQVLANEAVRQGVEIRYGHEITDVEIGCEGVLVSYKNDQGEQGQIFTQYLLDASGFARVLPRMLDLETPSGFPPRKSLFTHVRDNISNDKFDRNKILITVHPQYSDIWYWLIPFSNGTSSFGVVGEPALIDRIDGDDETVLKAFMNEAPNLRELLSNAEYLLPVDKILGYSANVKSLYGDRYALLGNAGEFLDPVFSSGVTIALKSASLAAPLVVRQIKGEMVDWEREYAQPLRLGVDTFRTFVEAWYDGRFQTIIFHPKQKDELRAMISSILAGYAWDADNPYVAEGSRRVQVLAELCGTA